MGHDYDRISQKAPNDCGVCCLAMLLEMKYWPVRRAVNWHYKNTRKCRFDGMSVEDDAAVAKRLGFKLTTHTIYPSVRAPMIKRLHSGLRAILTVPSVNVKGEWHAVYWDGEQLFDPSQLNRYGASGDRAFMLMIAAATITGE